MNRSLTIQRLCWKEYRQLLPLVIMLAVIGLLFQFLIALQDPIEARIQSVFFLGLPGLFAAGVGALLVGQEKETRTLYWMASLPIVKQDIVTVKLVAGAVGLAAVWVISTLLLLLTNAFSRYDVLRVIDIDLPYGILYSIFLLLIGFATAWTFRSTFVGLLVLVGFAGTFTITSNLISGYNPIDEFNSAEAYVLGSLVLMSAVALPLGWYAGLRALSPTVPAAVPAGVDSQRSFFDRSVVDRRAVQAPESALVWQFAAQNRAMLFGLAVIVGIAAASLAATQYMESNRSTTAGNTLPIVALVTGFMAVCWVGVLTFQGDNLGQRIRFLADRGIAPRAVWLTRQVVPIGFLVVGLTAVGTVLALAMVANPRNEIGARVFLNVPVYILVLFSLIIWTIYSFSQWVSQVLRSPIICAIIAPVVACMPFMYGAFAFSTLEAPLWILALVSFIPMIATYRMTQHWMDARTGIRFWLEHAGWLLMVCLLPAIPFLIVWCTYPSIPSSELAKLTADAKSFGATQGKPIELQMLVPPKDPQPAVSNLDLGLETQMVEGGLGGLPGNAIGGEAGSGSAGMGNVGIGKAGMGNDEEQIDPNALPKDISIDEERELQFSFIERQLNSMLGKAQISAYSVSRRLMHEAMMARVHLQDDGLEKGQISRYQRSIHMMTRIIEGSRQTPHLRAQHTADQHEVWLLNELQANGSHEFLGPELRQTAVNLLRDHVGREKARYRALVVDWGISQGIIGNQFKGRKQKSSRAMDHTIGDFAIPTGRSGTKLLSSRHVSTVAWQMKQYLLATDQESQKRAREQLAREWKLPATQSDVNKQSWTILAGGFAVPPWNYWHSDLEKQADALE